MGHEWLFPAVAQTESTHQLQPLGRERHSVVTFGGICSFSGDAPCRVKASSSLIRYGAIVLRVIRDKSGDADVLGYGTCKCRFLGVLNLE